MSNKDTKNTAKVAIDWRLIVPRFPNGVRDGHFTWLRAERDIWGGNPILLEDEEGMFWTHHPVDLTDWQNSFGCYLESLGLEPSDELNRRHIYADPDSPLAYMYWVEYLSHPVRGAYWAKWLALFWEASV